MTATDVDRKKSLGLDLTEMTFQVSCAEGEAADIEVYAQLCVPTDRDVRTIQVLLHGATYSSTYWDFPYQPERYSYVEFMAAQGYATLALDRIGCGRSTHPHSSRVDLDSNAYIVHQIVGALRKGAFTQAFDRVVLVGHSYGTVVASREAAVYHDVDALILSSVLHQISATGAAMLGEHVAGYYASQEPKFADLDEGYRTLAPGVDLRTQLLFQRDNVDPKVVELDETLKETVTIGEMEHLGRWMTDGTCNELDVPTFLAVGDGDIQWCAPDAVDCSSSASVRAAEAAFYSPASELEVFVLPNANHDLNLHLTAQDWFGAACGWLAARAKAWS
ncbi:pimeloyl-ACP methyl ester carboxylesterase [Marmoricola sp. URHA0025 HA25]